MAHAPPDKTISTTRAAPLPTEQPLAARVVGKVEYRQGDGAKQLVPAGRIEVQTTDNDATLSWADGETRNSAAIPMTDFKRYRASGAIVL